MMTDFERGIAAGFAAAPVKHGALPAAAQQLLREAAIVGGTGTPERAKAINRALRDIREGWPDYFRDDE